MWSASCTAIRASHGQTITLAPDLATAQPVVSDNGLKYAVTIRNGAMWNTARPGRSPPPTWCGASSGRCNPTCPSAVQPDFSDILAGYTDFCNGFAKACRRPAHRPRRHTSTAR